VKPPTKPISAKRLAANRANAGRSTGPRTPAGKARSAANSRKHGFAAACYSVVRLEELDNLSTLRTEFIHCYQPVNALELLAVERMALAQQAIHRVYALEAGLHTAAMNETVTPKGQPENLLNDDLTRDINVTISQNRSLCLAVGFQRHSGKSDTWKLFLRYQAQTERMYRRAVEEFDRLKALRHEFPNEPIEDLEDLENTPVEELLPPPLELSPEELARRAAALLDPTVAITSSEPPSFRRDERFR
jgi:hypothetical protein